jgi:hypothetical protein
MITRVVVRQKCYFRHKRRNTSCIVIVDLKFHTKRRRAKIDSKAKKGAFLRDKINDFKQIEGSDPNAKINYSKIFTY